MSVAGVFGKLRPGALKMIDLLFLDPDMARTITYQLYQGRNNKGESAKDSSWNMPAARVEYDVSIQEVNHVLTQVVTGSYIIRTKDLTGGVTWEDLNVNDNFADGEASMAVTSLDKQLADTLGVVLVVASGDV